MVVDPTSEFFLAYLAKELDLPLAHVADAFDSAIAVCPCDKLASFNTYVARRLLWALSEVDQGGAENEL